MFVLDVIPFSRTAPQGSLSYRSSVALPLGTLIDVPLRKKTVPGLVVGCVTVQEAKAQLKAAHFSLSKSSSKSYGTLPATLIRAAETIATYHATTLGAVLSSLLIPVLGEDGAIDFGTRDNFNIDRCEGRFATRGEQYQKLVESSEKDASILLVVPTLIEAHIWSERFKKHAPLVLTGAVSGTRREELLSRIGTHKGLSIVTPSFSFAPIQNLSHIIVERMSAGSYVQPKRPYIDMRLALTELARERGIPVTYGDYPLPLEYREDPGASLAEVSQSKVLVFDPREKIEEGEKKKNTSWNAIPAPVIEQMWKTVENGGRVAVLAIRRGYAPSVICRDCGTAVTDEYGRNMTFSVQGDTRFLRSIDGKIIKSADIVCAVCGSWNLMPLGIGIEQVEEAVRESFPDAPIVRIDADMTAKTTKKSIAAMREQMTVPGTIIIGTELMLPWFGGDDHVDLAVIASADSLLALPFWRARERFVRVGLMLAERSKKMLLVSRKPEDESMSAITDPTSSPFWKDEAALRKLLSYPPYGTLLVFHSEGNPANVESDAERIRAACSPHIPSQMPTKPISKTQVSGSFVLQLRDGAWPDQALAERFAALPPSIRMHVNAETFW